MAGDVKRLRDLRRGLPRKTISLGNGKDSFEICVVMLSADTMLDINSKVDEKYGTDSKSIAKSQYYNILLCTQCMRSVDDIEEHLVYDPDELASLLDLEDIRRVCEAYNELIINKAPKLETLKEEDYDALKKYFEVTPLKDLSTVSLVHLMYFLQTVRSEN